ncbi:VOC family protein [Rhodopseudomonas palustris]|uniref:VOC family protein n=1 Tax=Rhodopseudomonas palustris TaxID=1076 RepID=A0A418VJD0_RHOPL|nr:VOC family protein [Rhodopseudomonas palustris]
MLIDHIEIPVTDPDAARRFYEAALSPLQIACVLSIPAERSATRTPRHGLGRNGYPCLWLHGGEAVRGGLHIAFAAPDRATVDAFHTAALTAGGRNNGAPGIRPHYHSAYYAAYVLDPDANNIEVVCQVL